MGVSKVVTAVMIKGGFSFVKKRKPAVDILSPEEIDRLHPGMLFGMDRDSLVSLRRKLSVTEEELDIDCDPGTSEWRLWEKRLDKMAELMDLIDEKLEAVDEQED